MSKSVGRLAALDDVVDVAEEGVALSYLTPPSVFQARLREKGASALDDMANGAFSDAIGLRATRCGHVVAPPKQASRLGELAGAVGVEKSHHIVGRAGMMPASLLAGALSCRVGAELPGGLVLDDKHVVIALEAAAIWAKQDDMVRRDRISEMSRRK